MNKASLASNKKLTSLYTQLLSEIGEDIHREGLVKTPHRAAKALENFTQGYHQNIDEIVNGAVFESTMDEMILVKDIELFSLCEHHLLPFLGKCHVAYIPNGKVLGLSKVARIVDMFAKRLQIQENLTHQIAKAVQETVNAKGVAVVMEAKHLCMMMRGVQKQNSKTVTSAMRGTYLDDSMTRTEFLRLCGTDYSSVSS